MKKSAVILFAVLLAVLSVLSAYAQDPEESLSLAERYPELKVKNPFDRNGPIKYYRFPTDTLFFEPLDLSYFPHETWSKNDWALLGRWGNGTTYNQIIYSEKPATKQLIHGTDVTQNYGFLRDFYLYADLFVIDNYPENSGSCYIYYSDSLLTGYYESKGILIDPEAGIYSATNNYGGARIKMYSPSMIHHDLELIMELDPKEYELSAEDLSGTSIGGTEFIPEKLNTVLAEDMDAAFAGHLESLASAYRMDADPTVRAYRIEVVRSGGVSDIYINGKQVFSMDDGIKTTLEDETVIPDKVSWSFGPILNPEGLSVTCSIGDLYIYGTGQREE